MLFKSMIAGAVSATMLLSATTPTLAETNTDATDDVSWTITLELGEGQDEAFQALMAEMVEATKEEAGAKGYEWYRSGSTVHINERYETNADAGIHLGNFGENFAERFLAILTPTGLQVYGPAEGGVREGLAGFGATFYDQVGGFER
jgi:quinol monooxygenase YgiN